MGALSLNFDGLLLISFCERLLLLYSIHYALYSFEIILFFARHLSAISAIYPPFIRQNSICIALPFYFAR